MLCRFGGRPPLLQTASRCKPCKEKKHPAIKGFRRSSGTGYVLTHPEKKHKLRIRHRPNEKSITSSSWHKESTNGYWPSTILNLRLSPPASATKWASNSMDYPVHIEADQVREIFIRMVVDNNFPLSFCSYLSSTSSNNASMHERTRCYCGRIGHQSRPGISASRLETITESHCFSIPFQYPHHAGWMDLPPRTRTFRYRDLVGGREARHTNAANRPSRIT